ncbi:MAG: hypothetical protein GY754_27425 [bacterium]|nr:hypothetical protein [bacterium]
MELFKTQWIENYNSTSENPYVMTKEEFTLAEYKKPRPKDFYDIFVLYNLYYKKKITEKNKALIQKAIKKCFSIKNMDIKLTKFIESEKVKNFHSRDFEGQVANTLLQDSIYNDVTFDQIYSDTLELLDIINVE